MIRGDTSPVSRDGVVNDRVDCVIFRLAQWARTFSGSRGIFMPIYGDIWYGRTHAHIPGFLTARYVTTFKNKILS